MGWIFSLLVMLKLLSLSKSNPDSQERIQELETRVHKLEEIVEQLESTFVQRYGLIKRCPVPVIEHGFAQCNNEKDLKPKTRCRVVCNAGYIATPGRDESRCMEGGEWSYELKCEVPVVVISGGEINDGSGDSSVEVIDLERRKKCNVDIPDMTSQRTFHNLLYHPDGPEILACNGLNSTGPATCDKLDLSETNLSWAPHSNPHQGSSLDEAKQMFHSRDPYQSTAYFDRNPHKKYGRYAAESVTINNKPVIIGGMVNKGDRHEVTNTARSFDGRDWFGTKSGTKRAFFCIVKLQEGLLVDIGGFGSRQHVLKTVSSRTCGAREYVSPVERREFQDIPLPLSGHGCTVLPDSYDIIVAGGSRDERDNSQSGSYIYSWEKKAWNQTANLNTARFGHKLVTVGQNIFAIGGKKRVQDIHLDSIEMFDAEKREWNDASFSLQKPRAHFGLALVPRAMFPGCE